MAQERGRSPFLDEVRSAIRARQYGIRTEQTYLEWIRRFIVFHGKRHPREIGVRGPVGAVLGGRVSSVDGPLQYQAPAPPSMASPRSTQCPRGCPYRFTLGVGAESRRHARACCRG